MRSNPKLGPMEREVPSGKGKSIGAEGRKGGGVPRRGVARWRMGLVRMGRRSKRISSQRHLRLWWTKDATAADWKHDVRGVGTTMQQEGRWRRRRPSGGVRRKDEDRRDGEAEALVGTVGRWQTRLTCETNLATGTTDVRRSATMQG